MILDVGIKAVRSTASGPDHNVKISSSPIGRLIKLEEEEQAEKVSEEGEMQDCAMTRNRSRISPSHSKDKEIFLYFFPFCNKNVQNTT